MTKATSENVVSKSSPQLLPTMRASSRTNNALRIRGTREPHVYESLYCEILPHFDTITLSVASKLGKLERRPKILSKRPMDHQRYK